MNSLIKISYETTAYVEVGKYINLKVEYNNSCDTDFIWESLNEDVVRVNSGVVYGIKEGYAHIKVTYARDKSVNATFFVTVIPNKISKELSFVLKNHQSNIFKRKNLGIGAGRIAYYYDVLGSVNNLIFNEKLEINDQFYDKAQERYGEELKNRLMESVEFITVHYTGNMRDGANGYANSCWFAMPLDQNPTSIHYVTGNDGIYSSLDEKYIGAHAGDTSSVKEVGKFKWHKTNVLVADDDPKFALISINNDGHFTINGHDTNISVPLETRYGRGIVTNSKWLNAMGLPTKIIDNEYYLGTSWWCYSQISEGRICQTGGNHNSIGIESCVNEGSNLWYTWQKTALLVADLMQRHNLDITKVRGHHAFTAKNCPQPMLENDLELWYKFIDLVEAEYEKITNFPDLEVVLINDNDDIDVHGNVINEYNGCKMIELNITIKYNNKTENIKLGTII